MEEGRGLLLDFDASEPLRAMASHWNGRITYVAREAKNRLGLTAVLVRPDGFVAWASDTVANPVELVQVASRWFGAPNPRIDPC